jgi:CHASE1-domain containing sensor protein
MFSEATHHTAMERARDTGVTAMSGKVMLVQEIDTHTQAGFLMYLPVYRHDQPTSTPQQRQAALVGYLYASFRVNDLMQGVRNLFRLVHRTE